MILKQSMNIKRITSYDKVGNQIELHMQDSFSGFDGLNLAGINESDNERYNNNNKCFLSSLSISFQSSFLNLFNII